MFLFYRTDSQCLQIDYLRIVWYNISGRCALIYGAVLTAIVIMWIAFHVATKVGRARKVHRLYAWLGLDRRDLAHRSREGDALGIISEITTKFRERNEHLLLRTVRDVEYLISKRQIAAPHAAEILSRAHEARKMLELSADSADLWCIRIPVENLEPGAIMYLGDLHGDWLNFYSWAEFFYGYYLDRNFVKYEAPQGYA